MKYFFFKIKPLNIYGYQIIHRIFKSYRTLLMIRTGGVIRVYIWLSRGRGLTRFGFPPFPPPDFFSFGPWLFPQTLIKIPYKEKNIFDSIDLHYERWQLINSKKKSTYRKFWSILFGSYYSAFSLVWQYYRIFRPNAQCF